MDDITDILWADIVDKLEVEIDTETKIINSEISINTATADSKFINDNIISDKSEDMIYFMDTTNSSTIDDYKKKKQSEILDYQLQMLNNIKRNVKLMPEPLIILKNELNEQNIHSIEKIIEMSKYLCEINKLVINMSINKRKENMENNETTEDMSIKKQCILPRSSYKFCEFNYECEFNYGAKDKKCYAQHFVHNSVYHDLNVLLNYFIYHKSNVLNINIIEVNKSLNTLIFVVNHMLNEIKLVEYYQIDNIKKKKLKK